MRKVGAMTVVAPVAQSAAAAYKADGRGLAYGDDHTNDKMFTRAPIGYAQRHDV